MSGQSVALLIRHRAIWHHRQLQFDGTTTQQSICNQGHLRATGQFNRLVDRYIDSKRWILLEIVLNTLY